MTNDSQRCQQCREVNIADYLMSQEGFVPDTKRSNRAWVNGTATGSAGSIVLENPSTGEKYLVKKNPRATSEYQFYIVQGSMPGQPPNRYFTLIDYMLYKKNLPFGAALAAIERFAGLPQPLFKPISTVATPKKPRTASGRADITQLMPLTHLDYLHSRGITNATLQDPLLKSRIYNVQSHDFYNTAFPMWNGQGEMVTWCAKNAYGGKTYQHFPPNVSTDRCLFTSLPPAGNCDFLLFSETPMDALSYYQLHPHLHGRCLIVSSNGILLQSHLPLIQDMINRYSTRNVIAVNDKDAAGYRYDLMLAGSLHDAYQPAPPVHSTVSVRKNLNHHTLNWADVVLSADQAHLPNLEQIRHKFLEKMQQLSSFAVSEIVNKETEGIYFTVSTPIEQLHIKRMIDIIAHTTDGWRDFMLFDKPSGASMRGHRLKDWNEVVQDNRERGQAGKLPQLSEVLLPMIRDTDKQKDDFWKLSEMLLDEWIGGRFDQPLRNRTEKERSPEYITNFITNFFPSATSVHQLQVNIIVESLTGSSLDHPAIGCITQEVYAGLVANGLAITPNSDRSVFFPKKKDGGPAHDEITQASSLHAHMAGDQGTGFDAAGTYMDEYKALQNAQNNDSRVTQLRQ